jgi:hypothetical protein
MPEGSVVYRCPRCGLVSSLMDEGPGSFTRVRTKVPWREGVWCMGCWSDALAHYAMNVVQEAVPELQIARGREEDLL